jgi:uncharacterized membrane protein YgcG
MSRLNDDKSESAPLASDDQARRDFLKKAGRFAVVTPPAITLLLGTSLDSRAIAKSAGSAGKGGSRPGNASDSWGKGSGGSSGSGGSRGSAITFFKRHRTGQ